MSLVHNFVHCKIKANFPSCFLVCLVTTKKRKSNNNLPQLAERIPFGSSSFQCYSNLQQYCRSSGKYRSGAQALTEEKLTGNTILVVLLHLHSCMLYDTGSGFQYGCYHLPVGLWANY